LAVNPDQPYFYFFITGKSLAGAFGGGKDRSCAIVGGTDNFSVIIKGYAPCDDRRIFTLSYFFY
jgi:hypothetical protein